MKQATIDKIKRFGFDVYMRDTKDSYLYFTDGKNIGYLQYNNVGGFARSTVHKPNRQTGTGFSLGDGLADIDKTILVECFRRPDWALRMAGEPYKNIESFIAADAWNRGFKEVL